MANIQKLITLISNINIAEDILAEDNGEQRLRAIGSEAMEGFDADWDSMAEWRDDVDAGLDLVKPETKGRDEPWQGAANFKTPLIMEASIKFGDRASLELLKGNDLVKVTVVGNDDDNKKQDQAERIQEFMDWQLRYESEEWVEQHDKMLYDVSRQGTIFKKTFFDPELGHNSSDVIMHPNFAINQNTKTLASARRFSHKLTNIGPNQIKEKQLSGIWLDIELEEGASEEDNEEAPKDKITDFIEQQTFIDLDGDGYQEPYIVTFHTASRMPVRIVAQYGLEDIRLMDNEGRTTSLDRIIAKDETGNPMITDGAIALVDPDKERKVVRITRKAMLTKYGFEHDPEGKFLDVGWFHLLGSYASLINSTSNNLLDGGALANLGGGWLAKGFRKKMGDLKIKPGVHTQTGLSAADLQSGIMPYNFKEPSQTLLALNGAISQEAQRLASTADIASAIGANAPAATTLALVHEQQQANGAIISRIYRAMAREFRIWYQLDATFIDPQQYQNILDDEKADFQNDFNTDRKDIMSSANPENSSKIQRIQTAAAGLDVIDQVVATQGDPKPLVKEYLTAIGSNSVDEVYPEMTEEQQAELNQETKDNKDMAMQERIVNLEAIDAVGDSEREKAATSQFKAETERLKAVGEAPLTEAKTAQAATAAVLNIEKAETENTKNAGTLVSAEIEINKDRREDRISREAKTGE